MEASSASEEKSSRSVRRMSLSLPLKDMGIHLTTNVRNNIDNCMQLSTFVYVFQSSNPLEALIECHCHYPETDMGIHL